MLFGFLPPGFWCQCPKASYQDYERHLCSTARFPTYPKDLPADDLAAEGWGRLKGDRCFVRKLIIRIVTTGSLVGPCGSSSCSAQVLSTELFGCVCFWRFIASAIQVFCCGTLCMKASFKASSKRLSNGRQSENNGAILVSFLFFFSVDVG